MAELHHLSCFLFLFWFLEMRYLPWNVSAPTPCLCFHHLTLTEVFSSSYYVTRVTRPSPPQKKKKKKWNEKGKHFLFTHFSKVNPLMQGFSIIFSCGPQRAKDSSKIDVWGPNDHHCPVYFYVYWSWQRAKQAWSAGRIWPTGRHLRRPALMAPLVNLAHFTWSIWPISPVMHDFTISFRRKILIIHVGLIM